MPENDHYVIIGNGPAGNHAADVLRDNDKEARISIISDEPVIYYYRHKLNEFITGKMDEDSLKVRPSSYYKKKNIRLRLGQRVDRIDPEKKILYLSHMEKVGFTKLVLAVGGTPRALPAQAGYEKHLTFMNNFIDAVKLKDILSKTKRIVVLGGDLISLSLIKELVKLNRDIKLFLYKASFWPLVISDSIVEKVSSSMLKNNIKTYAEDPIKSITKKGSSFTVKTGSGETFTTDIILSFTGLTPNIKFIAGSGIDIERGVLVDNRLRTNFKDIYACGDCAQIYNPEIKDYWISIGWDNAKHQGRVVAYNILGKNKTIKPVTKKIIDIEGIKLKTSWWQEL